MDGLEEGAVGISMSVKKGPFFAWVERITNNVICNYAYIRTQ